MSVVVTNVDTSNPDNIVFLNMATKKAAKKRSDVPTPIRIPDDLKKKALKRAEQENRTLSNLILTALIKYLKH